MKFTLWLLAGEAALLGVFVVAVRREAGPALQADSHGKTGHPGGSDGRGRLGIAGVGGGRGGFGAGPPIGQASHPHRR